MPNKTKKRKETKMKKKNVDVLDISIELTEQIRKAKNYSDTEKDVACANVKFMNPDEVLKIKDKGKLLLKKARQEIQQHTKSMNLDGNSKSICMGIPTLTKNPITIDWAFSMRSIQGMLGSSSTEIIVKDKMIDEARNEIVEFALSKGCSHLFFLGDDVHPQYNVIKRLWYRDVDMVTGIYWTKEYPSMPYIWKDMNGPYLDWTAGEFFEIWGAGCDCLLIKTEVFKKIKEPWFSLDYHIQREEYKNAMGYDMVFSHPDKKSISTEDFYFYEKARKAGFKLWADTSVQCLHQNRHTGGMFGLTTSMPQYSDKAQKLYQKLKSKKKKKIADLRMAGQADIGRSECDLVRFDSRENERPDYRTDFTILPYHGEMQKFDEVNVEHVLEYYDKVKSLDLIKDWMMLCKKGGKFTITIPDMHERINGKLDD